MNTAIDWITNNQWAFKYIAYAFWFFAILMLKDFIFRIHWVWDILFALIATGFLAWIYFFV